MSLNNFDSVKREAIVNNYINLRDQRNKLRDEYNNSTNRPGGKLSEIKSFDSLLEHIERIHPDIIEYYDRT